MSSQLMVFADRKKPYAYSVAEQCSDGVYRSQITGKTLEEVQKEHPDAEMIGMDDFVEITEKMATTDPTEIDENRYWYLLEVLPPCSWQRCGSSESFYMSEFTSGRVTNHVVRIGKRYFNFEAPVMQNHSERVAKVMAWLESQPGEAKGE